MGAAPLLPGNSVRILIAGLLSDRQDKSAIFPMQKSKSADAPDILPLGDHFQMNDNHPRQELAYALQHCASLFQIHSVVAIREPAIFSREQRTRVINSSGIPPDLRQARRGPQFEQSRILPLRRCQSALEQRLHLGKRCALGQSCAGSYAKPFSLGCNAAQSHQPPPLLDPARRWPHRFSGSASGFRLR